MNTGGGFLLDAGQGGGGAAPAGSLDSARSSKKDRLSKEEDTFTVRKLTQKQEMRLMNYLDDAFLQINRGFNKRHDPSSSSVPTLSSFIQAYASILLILASIPPIGPSASLLVSYLLRYTNELLDGISGYEVCSKEGLEGDDDDESEKRRSLDAGFRSVIQSVDVLDRVWSCVLRGQMVDLKAVTKNVETSSQNYEGDFPMQNHAEYSRAGVEGTVYGTEAFHEGRFPPPLASGKLQEGKSFVGSKGHSTVAQTNRIRLRNVMTLAKENLFGWMRVQLDVPLPPRVVHDDEENEEDGKAGRGEVFDQQEDDPLGVKVEGEGVGSLHGSEVFNVRRPKKEILDQDAEASEEEEEDLEEVNTNADRMTHAYDDEEEKTEEHNHFETLFAQKIDPDALDSEEEEEEDEDEEDEEQRSRHRKRSRSPPRSPSPRHHQRLHSASSPDDASFLPDTESVATFSGTAAVMKWDLQFARLFAHSLRCLSDIQEHTNVGEVDSRREGKQI
ncbi:hypothetical protein CBS101457_004578 [Exobasidium rhododendri]|nr:hypothetical protein CBS101457_004578 [Exobasidium rhododendri]